MTAAHDICSSGRARRLAAESALAVRTGHATATGPRPCNEDFCGLVTPNAAELDGKGLLAAVADGVGGHANGREASEYTVRGLLSDYYATPDTWAVNRSLDVVIAALNQWLIAHAARSRETAGMATTLSALVLRGRRFHTAHVGDSRIYRLRGGRLERLTADHVWEHPELSHVLSRAIGLDAHLLVDYADGDLEPGDVFALLTDGVWHTLGDARIAAVLAEDEPQPAAERLVWAAGQAGARDNATALVLCVDTVPADLLGDAVTRLAALPLPPRLKVGQMLDGLTVDEVLHESRATLLYRVTGEDGRTLVLKTLREGADSRALTALAHEEWLAGRVPDAHFPMVVPKPRRSCLYYLVTWHDGATLRARLASGHRFGPAEVAELGQKLLKGVGALHRLSIVHRDIKPENVHLDAGGCLRVLDLGVAASSGRDSAEGGGSPGTPSYMAPELFGPSAARANEASDLYAVGVTLYELLTRRYPYGEVEPFQNPRFTEPVTPTRYRPDTPAWLEAVLLKAVARDPAERFETAEEFVLALERGAHRPLAMPHRKPLVARDPQRALTLLAIGSLVLNLLLLLLLLARSA